MLLSGFLHIFNNGKSPETTTKVNIGISNMGYLEYPGYVEVGRRSRPFSLYIYDLKNYWYLEYGYLEYPAYVEVCLRSQ